MEKIWYIKIQGKQQGPFSVEQLKGMKEITLDTLVWSPKLKDWVPLRLIPELKEIFSDFEEDEPDSERTKEKSYPEETGELVLEMQPSLPPLLFWLCLFFAVAALILWQLSE